MIYSNCGHCRKFCIISPKEGRGYCTLAEDVDKYIYNYKCVAYEPFETSDKSKQMKEKKDE